MGPFDTPPGQPGPPPVSAPLDPPPAAPSVSPPPATGWQQPDPSARLVPEVPSLAYAGAGVRLVAYLVDAFLLGIVHLFLVGVALPEPTDTFEQELSAGVIGATIAGIALDFAYFVWLWRSSGRATLGMRIFDLQVGAVETGATLALGAAVRRWILLGASPLLVLSLVPALTSATLIAMALWALVLIVTTAVDPRHRGIHDRFGGSAVVRPAARQDNAAIVGCLVLALVAIGLFVLAIVAIVLVAGSSGLLPPDVGVPI